MGFESWKLLQLSKLKKVSKKKCLLQMDEMLRKCLEFMKKYAWNFHKNLNINKNLIFFCSGDSASLYPRFCRVLGPAPQRWLPAQASDALGLKLKPTGCRVLLLMNPVWFFSKHFKKEEIKKISLLRGEWEALSLAITEPSYHSTLFFMYNRIGELKINTEGFLIYTQKLQKVWWFFVFRNP